MGVASSERAQLSDLFEQVGPDAPTLCGGWQTRDLAAHLAVRDRRPDAAGGILIAALAGYTEKVQQGYADRSWSDLVDLVRTGPPAWSPYRIGAVDELVNGAEFFVHHEDVRRATPGWTARSPEPQRDAAMWRAVRMVGKRGYRHSPVGILLRKPDGEVVVAKRGPNSVTLQGPAGELLLHAFGRDEVSIDYDGDQAAIAAVQELDRSF